MLTPTGVRPAPPVDAYEQALAVGDLDAIEALFVEDGYVREPAGDAFRHTGPQGRAAFYEPALSAGGVPLQLCTATDDGPITAFEYVCARWGSFDLAPQAGAAVYERASDGRLLAVRIYDDVSPPAALFSNAEASVTRLRLSMTCTSALSVDEYRARDHGYTAGPSATASNVWLGTPMPVRAPPRGAVRTRP